MRAVDRHVADNETERNHKRVLDIIRKAGPSGLTKTELTRKTQFLDRRTRDEALMTLTEAGLVTTRLRPSSTRHDRRAGPHRGRCGMRSFKPQQIFQAARFSQR